MVQPALWVGLVLAGCSSSSAGGPGTGGAPQQGAEGTSENGGGGASNAGASSGGTAGDGAGGSSPAVGGSSTGGRATGGARASGGASAGGAASGGSGGVVASGGSAGAIGCPREACGTHRFACWPMPNTVASGLSNPASYMDLGDGTVRDNVTCLIWERTVAADGYSVTDARAHCASKGAGWRVATRIESMSIDDVSQSGAKVDPMAFPSVPRAFFKTGSEWVLTTKQIGAGKGKDLGWAFNFSDGIVSNARSGATADRVRCVKGGGDEDLDAAPSAIAMPPPNQYEMEAAGEVRDRYTGLVWQQGTSDTQMAWADAAAYCAKLGLNGHTFRLPSIRELSTLVDESQVAPAIDRNTFPGTKYGSRSENWYWASERAAGSTSAAWALNFDDGFTGANTATDSSAWNYFTAVWVRCVR